MYRLRGSVKVEVSNIGAGAVSSHLEPLGIALVEELLIRQEPEGGRAAKRARTDTPVSKDVNNWIELSRWALLRSFKLLL